MEKLFFQLAVPGTTAFSSGRTRKNCLFKRPYLEKLLFQAAVPRKPAFSGGTYLEKLCFPGSALLFSRFRRATEKCSNVKQISNTGKKNCWPCKKLPKHCFSGGRNWKNRFSRYGPPVFQIRVCDRKLINIAFWTENWSKLFFWNWKLLLGIWNLPFSTKNVFYLKTVQNCLST